MKQADAHNKLSSPDHHRSCLNYEGKPVEFLYDVGGKLLLLTGHFVVCRNNQSQYLEIDYTGRLDPRDPPFSDYRFQVSEPHLRSTVAATKSGSPMRFLMEKPLRSHECARLETWEPDSVVP